MLISSVSILRPWCDERSAVIWLWDIHSLRSTGRIICLSMKTKGYHITCMYDNYVVVSYIHLSLMPCIRTRLWRVWSDQSDRWLGIICPYSIWYGLHPLEYHICYDTDAMVSITPSSDHRGTTCPYDCRSVDWGNADTDGEHSHMPPKFYIGLTGSWCLFRLLSYVSHRIPWFGIPLSSVSVIIPWVFKHRDVNMLVSSVSILRPWCDETVLYRHTVMSRFNQLSRLLIMLCIHLLQTLYSFVRVYVYYTFVYMRIYIYVYMYVCVYWLQWLLIPL